jgi:hypothetical protein
MYKLLLAATGLWVLSACNQPKKATTEQPNEWQSLFDGKTTTGWHTFNKTTIGSAWKVEDGTLHLDPREKENWQTKGGGDIVYETEYDNFHLKLEWKIAEKGNSGIIYYVQEGPQYEWCWKTGLEMQVLDNKGHADAQIKKHRAGDLYDLIECNKETVKPAGEWNLAEIICKDGLLQHYLNGVKVVETTLWNDAWRTLVANSKFKEMPGWGTFKKGKIALQDHGDHVWYRKIMIKRL